eukprot:TRINITY_DN40_c0_g5_i1.p1 TRINITY_DN40_c0_g5~~TRINITY_DN40_c0_g5_i1.p1  ORF type:complete len:116 (+),score=17.60 TRINITY_DN40_c0_g5_i1:247-594(+)
MQGIMKLVNHPAGPKTIFFWAPLAKWALVIAGINDLTRPAEKISVPQSVALSATGLIWARYATQIIPVNYNLLSVNIFVAVTGILQISRKFGLIGDIPFLTKATPENTTTSSTKQ